MKVVIVGAGAAGVFTAHRLRRRLGAECELVLLDATPRFGGNAMSRSIAGVDVECGAQFFHRGAQPGFIALLDELDLWSDCEVVRTAAGFTIWDRPQARRLLHLPATVAGFRRLGLGDWGRAAKFGLFIGYCYALERWERNWSISVADWLAGMRLLDDTFKREVVVPFLYQFVSLPAGRIGDASAKYAVTYLMRTMFPGDGPTPVVPRIGRGRPTFEAYQSLVGLQEVHRRVLAAADVQPRLSSAVQSIRQLPDGSLRVTCDDHRIDCDHVVLATDPHVAARVLAAGGTAPSELVDGLRGLEYARLPISMQHGVPAHMPTRRADWQPFNTVVDGDDLMFTVWFGPMRPPAPDGSPLPLFKSWGSPRLQPDHPESEHFAHHHFVPLPTTDFVRERDRVLARWQGAGAVWLAGGWTRWFDSQEAALVSATECADGIVGAARYRTVRAPAGPLARAPVVELLDRCATHAPATMRGALLHAVDEVEARG